MNEKCLNCKINEEIENSDCPSVCAWYMDNVVLGDKTITECTEYRPIKSE